MCDPTSEKQGRVRLGQIDWIEGVSVGEEIADMVESHDNHYQAAKHVDGVKT